MTINELIEELRYLADMYDMGEMDVRVAHQPQWPLAETISAITVAEKDGERKCWLATYPVGRYENPYAPRTAWEGGIEGEDFGDDEDIDEEDCWY